MGWDEGVDATNGIHIMAKICLSESYCINVLILSISAKGMFAQFRFSQMEGAVEVERPLVRASLEALCCVLEQDTCSLHPSQYWCIPGKRPDMTKNCWLVRKASTQSNSSFTETHADQFDTYFPLHFPIDHPK